MLRLRHAPLVLIPAILFAGCGNQSPAPLAPSDIYPLTTGSVWKYTAGLADTVSGTTDIAGKEYAVLQGSLFPHVFARTDAGGQFLVRDSRIGTLESVLFDFDVPAGSSWSFAGPSGVPAPTVTLISKDDTMTVPAGTFTGCYTFFFDVSGNASEDVTYVVAPGVGLIYLLDHSGLSYSLVEYTPGPS